MFSAVENMVWKFQLESAYLSTEQLMHSFAGFSACSGYSGKHTLVHDGDHGGGHTNPDLSFIVIVGALVTSSLIITGVVPGYK